MKTAVITGGNSGIGKATAIELSKKGYRVIIHGRDAAKTKTAAEEIKQASGNENVDYIALDISAIRNMRVLADTIKAKTDKINALVLSTGVILPNHIFTDDDLEAGFAIQYLSRFAITQMLLPELKNGRAKIVSVVAPLLKNASIHFDDIAFKNNFTMMGAMAQEMFANHLFVQEFAKRHPNNEIVINMAHPGISKTGIMRHSNFFLRMLVGLVGQSAQKASKNFVYLATDDEVSFSGYFLRKSGKTSVKEKANHDPLVSQRLWEISMDLIKPYLN